ncbi:MAG TPA: FGGY family carbohydrate kinase [Dongiaceae bacterium]|jgi:glycerol kinase|nr:FGGY family carbohydrate kinase [Dongiaceae bacterium]
MAKPLILAIDQGTSSTKCLLVDEKGAIVASGSAPLGESHPKPGWVEQDANEIWSSVRKAVAACLEGKAASEVVAVGFSTQRESAVAWDRRSGEPLSPVLSWQDQRTAAICDALRAAGAGPMVRERCGLPIDPMFSAAKAKWLLDQLDPERVRARSGSIVIGTVDAFLLSRFSDEPMIEAGNASRTQLMETRKAAWDQDLLDLFGVPTQALPRVVSSIGPFPKIRDLAPLPDGVPVCAVMGDSHAALFAHGAFTPGAVKATFGTGSSVMGLLDKPDALDPGLCLTIAWALDTPAFAAEGNIRAAGSTLRWVAEILNVSVDELARLAASASSDGIMLVPAFNGLGAPWWDDSAVGLLIGLKLDSSRAAIARAAFESIPHQVADVVDAVDRSVGKVRELHADGGSTRNDSLMQMATDLTGRPIKRSHAAELSALGAAHLAGHAAGIWSLQDLTVLPRRHDRFVPAMPPSQRETERALWARAISRSRGGGNGAPTVTNFRRRAG